MEGGKEGGEGLTEAAELLFAQEVGRDRFVRGRYGVFVQHVFREHVSQPVQPLARRADPRGPPALVIPQDLRHGHA